MAFLDWELPNIRRGGRRMSENEISIICNGKNRNSITFNIAVTELVVNKGYTYIQIKQDDVTGEIGFEFNNERGLKIKAPKGEKHSNICLENKGWVCKVAIHLDLPTDGTRTILNISKNLSTIDKCMFFRVINK